MMTGNFQINGVYLTDYGVYVTKSQGLLDIPRVTNPGHDWLDLHGQDYDAEVTPMLAEREIVLQCWIYATGYSTFITKVNAFFAAIQGAGYKLLSTTYGDFTVYLKEEVPVVRESQYIASEQIGSFTLRLTVPGTSRYQSVPIYVPAGTYSGINMFTNNLQINRTLQGDSYATCSVESDAPLAVDMYYYIMVNTNGITPEPYYFMAKPEVNKASSNKFVYNLRLEHGSILLKQPQFMFEGLSDFEIFSDLDTIVDLVCECADRFISGKFVKGTIAGVADGVVKKNHAFKGEDCLSVVKRMAQEYGLEYDVRYEAAKYTIDLKKQVARTIPMTLQYGRGQGLYDLQREAPNRDELVTVLYAYGSTKNLKPDYRGGKPRLEFDGNPLRQNDTLYMGVEKAVFFDDIYPQRTAPIDAYTQVLACEEGDPGWAAYAAIMEQFPGGMYRITDNDVFDIKSYLLGGLTAKIRFKTGELAGYEFEIIEYEHTPGYIYIKPFKEADGYMLPNETLYPSEGDEYTLVDIDQPESYVTVAEAELLAQAQEYLDKYSVPQYPYRATVDPAFLAPLVTRFEVGDRITIEDTDLGINQPYRISQFTYHAINGRYDLTLSEHRILTRRERQQVVIDRVERTQEKTDAQAVETIRKDKETTAELRNRIFDPADDRQSLDTTVRDESVDPRMLAFDASTIQFQLRGCIAESPWEDDFNKIHIGSGFLELLNWPDNTLSRYDIYKLERDGGTYDPRRTWSMPDTVITLPDSDGYYLIAKLPRDPDITAGEWVASDFFIRTKVDPDYIQFTAGYANRAESPRVLSMLWGNVRVSPGQITASIDPRLLTSGQMIYLHTEDSDLTGYKQALTTQPEDAMATYSAAADSSTGDVLIEEFSTESDYPGVTVIPAGPWIFNHWVAVGSGTQSSVVVKVYKRVAAGTETELLTFTQTVTAAVAAEQFKAMPMAQVELLATDRLVVKYYHRNTSATSATMYLFIEGNATAEYKWSGYRIPLAPDGGGLATVETDMSVTGDGSVADPVTLVGDTATPGNTKYYGTNEAGEKGFHALPSGLAIGDWDEDISFDFNDVEADTAQTYYLDRHATFPYKVIAAFLETDSTMDDVTIEINGSPITWADDSISIDVTATGSMIYAKTDYDNIVATGDVVTLETSGTDGDPTLIAGKIVIQRI